MRPAIAVRSCGMVTGVGLSAPATCAAIRGGVDNLQLTKFMLDGGFVRGSAVPLPGQPRGPARWLQMVYMAIEEAIVGVGVDVPRAAPLLLCLPERGRPGRPDGLDASLVPEIRARFGFPPAPAPDDQVIEAGRVGMAEALTRAAGLLARGLPMAIVVAVDSLLSAESLEFFHTRDRLLTEKAQDGFLPGEAAAAVVLAPATAGDSDLQILGVGRGVEKAAVDSGQPLRGDGLSQAIKAALSDAGVTFAQIDYRLSDVNGEQYGFKEASLALSRTMRPVRPEMDIWHPASLIGEVGAAIGPIMLGVAWTAARKRYAPGPGVLCQLGNDDGARAAIVLNQPKGN